MTFDNQDPDNNEIKPIPKPSGMELILIILFLAFIAWGTFKFGIWIVKDGGGNPHKIWKRHLKTNVSLVFVKQPKPLVLNR